MNHRSLNFIFNLNLKFLDFFCDNLNEITIFYLVKNISGKFLRWSDYAFLRFIFAFKFYFESWKIDWGNFYGNWKFKSLFDKVRFLFLTKFSIYLTWNDSAIFFPLVFGKRHWVFVQFGGIGWEIFLVFRALAV